MRVHRELNPALAPIAAARNCPRQLFLKYLREVWLSLFRRLRGLSCHSFYEGDSVATP
jgi:hypothetical protein